MPTSDLYRKKAASVDTNGPRRKKSWGPCFVIVCDDTGVRIPYHIESYSDPTPEQIRATAERRVQDWCAAYRAQFHWELPREPWSIDDPLRGQSALAEAKRRVLDDPNESLAKKFLLESKSLGKSFALPPEPKREEYATRAMLDRLEQPASAPSGPMKDWDETSLPMDPSED